MVRVISHVVTQAAPAPGPPTPEPSSPDLKFHPSSKGHWDKSPPRGSPALAHLQKVPGWNMNAQQASPPQNLLVAKDGVTTANRTQSITPPRSNRVATLGGEVSKSRPPEKMDPLGGSSLHSYLGNTTKTAPPPPRRNFFEGADIQEEPPSYDNHSKTIRSRPSVTRAKSGVAMPVGRQGDGFDNATRGVTRSNSMHGPRRGMHGRPYVDYSSRKNMHSSDLSNQMDDCYQYVNKRSCSPPQPSGWALFLFVSSILAAAVYFANEHFRLQFAHKALVQANAEKNRMIGELQTASKKQKFYQANYYEHMDLSEKIAGGLLDTLHSQDSDPAYIQQKKLENYDNQVKSLQATIRDMARHQLQDTFPAFPASDVPTIETEVALEGLSSPLVFAISHQEVPYAAWSWLDQVRKGQWNPAELSHVGDDDFIELTSTAAVSSTSSISKLTFREQSINSDDRFVLGIRNPHKGAEHGLIVTIHLTRGSCGVLDEQEVCFGKVVGGFDSLRTLRALKEPVRVASIQVRQ